MGGEDRPILRGSLEVVANARQLRRNHTPAEQLLWSRLRSGALGVKVRRQQTIGPFIVDFFIPAVGLIIEIDGSVHDRPDVAAQDAARTEYLEAVGMAVIRFTNHEVLFDTELTLARIADHCARLRPKSEPGTGQD